MLQIQQVSADSRPSPILDVYQPSIFMSGAARPLSKRLKLRKRDICIARSEYLESLKVEEMPPDRSQNGLFQNKEIVAVIRPCQKKNNDSVAQGEVYFQEGQCWICTTVSHGSYQFTMKHKDGTTKTALWRTQRDKDLKNLGESSARTPNHSARVERFLFFTADPAGNYTSPLAIMTRKGIEVFGQGSKTGPLSTEYLQDLGLRNLNDDYSAILTFGTWVAFQEDWFM
jgi:hypothetical protein